MKSVGQNDEQLHFDMKVVKDKKKLIMRPSGHGLYSIPYRYTYKAHVPVRPYIVLIVFLGGLVTLVAELFSIFSFGFGAERYGLQYLLWYYRLL